MTRSALLLLLAVAILAAPASSLGAISDEQTLAERYAPIVRLVTQENECGPGEPYEPMDVNALFGEPTVALRGPWSANDLVKIGPTAQDLSRGLYQYHLDFPGNALEPGCDYERWARRVTEGHVPTVYAHVATDRLHPEQLALQYWLYYAYNDWNNLHEGDWEMIQLVFDARNAHDALTTAPTNVGYSQHEGAERAAWSSSKLERVGGTHPVVYPAAGSHANFYDEGLFLGSSASQGSAATTRPGRTTICTRRWRRSPARRPRRASSFPGSPSRAAGGSCNGRSSTDLRGLISRRSGMSRSAGRRIGAVAASPSQPQVYSAPPRPTSSAVRSEAAHRRSYDS